ncbi:MAG: PAS domain S-box protein [Opitutaceae bacterium]|nr:PAS domain S-box protein [Opitutaceae bacterium]
MTRILIVDDNSENRYLLRTLLVGHGFAVEEASDGAEALTKARQSPPHLVIADLFMPVMDGFTLLRHWKVDPRLKLIPYVVYTATYTDPEDEKLALDLGADAFILKPAEPEALLAQLREVIAAHQAGQIRAAPPWTGDDAVLARQYSAALIRKLEEKALALDRANRDLAAREARLRLIFDTEPECVKLLAADGVLQEMNHAGLRMIEADSIGQVADRCIYPLVAEAHREAFRRLNEETFQGKSGTLEFELVGLKGGRRWLETHSAPLRDASGSVVSQLAITRDITARKRDEALLNGQKRVLELIAVGAPLAETAALLLRVLEAHTPEMIGSLQLLDADGVHLRHCAAPRLPAAFIAAIDGVAIGLDVGSCGSAAFRGEMVIVEDIATDPRWAGWRGIALAHGLRACWSTPVLDEQRRVLGTLALYYRQPGRPAPDHQRLVDLATQTAAIAIVRQRTEAALRASESRYRRLIEANLIGVIIADIEGNITEANDYFLTLTGVTRAAVAAGSVRWDAMTPPQWRAVDEALRDEVMRTGKGGPVEKEYYHVAGHRIPIRASVALLEGSPRACICLVEDLTAQKRAEQKLHVQLDELRRWQQVTLGREDRVRELKQEVNALQARLGEPPAYGGDEAR